MYVYKPDNIQAIDLYYGMHNGYLLLGRFVVSNRPHITLGKVLLVYSTVRTMCNRIRRMYLSM